MQFGGQSADKPKTSKNMSRFEIYPAVDIVHVFEITKSKVLSNSSF